MTDQQILEQARSMAAIINQLRFEGKEIEAEHTVTLCELLDMFDVIDNIGA